MKKFLFLFTNILAIIVLNAQSPEKSSSPVPAEEVVIVEYGVNSQSCPTTVIDYDGNIYNTIKLGNQCWMKENLRTTHYANGKSIPLGGTCTYSLNRPYRYYPDNNPSNVSTYGYLYNWRAIMGWSPASKTTPSGVQGICPNGWHIPSPMEWWNLTNYVGSQSRYACGKYENHSHDYIYNKTAKAVAATTGWKQSTGSCEIGDNLSANNLTGFSILPAGNYYHIPFDKDCGFYSSFGNCAKFWSTWATDFSGPRASSWTLCYRDTKLPIDGAAYIEEGLSVRCVQDPYCSDGHPCPNSKTVSDYDGNTYNTVKIGEQCWIKENLRTTHYADGTFIPLGSSPNTITGYRYYPDNDSSYVTTYGYLYNWKAVMRNYSSSSSNPSGVQGICPTGWHVPSNEEWNQLTTYVCRQPQYTCGSYENIARALASNTGWNWNRDQSDWCDVGSHVSPSPNQSTGFSALPAGHYDGGKNLFYNPGSTTFFWSSTKYKPSPGYLDTRAICRGLHNDWSKIYMHDENMDNGYSVRCVRN